LISVPKLPPNPPDFTDRQFTGGQPPGTQTPREHTPPPEDIWGSVASLNQEPQWSRSSSAEALDQQLVLQQTQMIRNNSVENELANLRQQNAYAQQLMAGYEGRIAEMNGRMQDYERRIAGYDMRHYQNFRIFLLSNKL
jgi:hypothetical protein